MRDELSKAKPGELKSFADRLRWARARKGLSADRVAHAAGVHRSYVAKMENGEAESPAATIAIRAAEALGVRVSWLVLGEGSVSDAPDRSEDGGQDIVQWVSNPANFRASLLAMADAVSSGQDPALGDAISALPPVNDSVNSFGAVKTLEELRFRLNVACSQYGKKAELAKFLGVSPAQLSPWLAGKREPGGEVTLQMLAWVQAAEVKTKNPAGAQTPTGQQTRSKPISYEKPESSPPGP